MVEGRVNLYFIMFKGGNSPRYWLRSVLILTSSKGGKRRIGGVQYM